MPESKKRCAIVGAAVSGLPSARFCLISKNNYWKGIFNPKMGN